MKNVQLGIALVLIATMAVFMPSCKKDKPHFVLTALGDSAGVAQTTFTYDASGKMIKFGAGTTNYDFYYSGDKLIARSYTSSGTIENIDSFRYDAQNRVSRVDDYDVSSNVLVKSTTFSYNSDNSINSASVHYASLGSKDELYNYTYEGGKLKKREDMEKIATVFKKKTETEFLAYDNHDNPFKEIYQKYLIDQFSLFVFVWSYPYNFTSVKQTSYDTTTGDVTSVSSAVGTYKYNADGLPERVTFEQDIYTVIYTFAYQQL